ANALELGGVFLTGLKNLMSRQALIGDVRGLGLMLGMELVKDRATKEPAKEECKRIMERTKELGLLVGRGGYYGNVIRIKPPLCLTRADVDFALEVLGLALAEV
ncbi:MAG: aminotransferase class III-fold pyridoxal phosphate-dependent enzyme, partial [Desulfobacterota bacterium]|nr:aminotransferase class III-fold pyridoxal phosphate-dependent enzyme [Thermodesulfobacteriota bacterium]